MNDTTIERLTATKPVCNRAEIIARIKEHEADMRALYATALYIYGPAADDSLTSESDIDVFVDYDREGPFSFVEWVRGSDVLGALLGRKVSFTTRDGLDRGMRADIEATCVRVF